MIYNFASGQFEEALFHNLEWIKKQIQDAKQNNTNKIALPLNWENHATLLTIEIKNQIEITYYDSSNMHSVKQSREKKPTIESHWSLGNYQEAF